MQIRYMPATIMLIAGAITSIISIINKFDVFYSLKLLLGALVLFYLIGLISQKIIIKVINNDKKGNKKMEEEIQETADEQEENVEQENAEEN